MGAMKTISIAGHTALDYIFDISAFPSANSSACIKDYKQFYGGGAANTAAAIAKLGGDCELISPVGADFIDSDYETHLLNLGVKLGRLIRVEDEKTAKAYVFNDDEHNQITYFYWGASTRFPELEAPEVQMAHLATACPKFNVRMSQAADFVSFDPGQDLMRYSKKDLLSIFSRTDILFANRHEIQRICEMIDKSFSELTDVIGTIVVTYDVGGSKIYKGDAIDIPIVKANSVDPTGAGDGYRAGFLVGVLKGCDLKVCGKIGATVASFIVEKRGCQTNLPTWEQMCRRYVDAFGDKL